MTDESPLDAYRRLRREGQLKADPSQELAVEKLQALALKLGRYEPNGGSNGGLLSFFRRKRNEEPPQGLYLYGGVGRGKSMLMDLFFARASIAKKRRVHFHAFMLETHARINAFRRTPPEERDGDDPIPPVARDLAAEAWLLCFDEFEVRDVADAMILGRLFTQLFERGVVVVATSNRAPDELYIGGLNRQLFLPFIDLLKRQIDVLHLESGRDYRLMRLDGQPVYHAPLSPAADAALDENFRLLTDEAKGEPDELEVQGRQVTVPEQARGVARFTFEELCARPLGAADYLALAERYHTIILKDVPQLSPDRRNEARRFATLIDVLYDSRRRLICSAAAPPDRLYPEGDGHFEFARTVSRLNEMQSAEYLREANASARP
jgi:cell division protein ZapE